MRYQEEPRTTLSAIANRCGTFAHVAHRGRRTCVATAAGGFALLCHGLDTQRHRQRQGIACRRGARFPQCRAAGIRAAAAARRSRLAGNARTTGGSAECAAAGRAALAAGRGVGCASREEITAAYQTALKSKVVASSRRRASHRLPPRRSRRIDPDELAALLKRAKGLLAVGDITSARLLLERAADATGGGSGLHAGGDLRSAGAGRAGHAQHHARSGDGAQLGTRRRRSSARPMQSGVCKARTRHHSRQASRHHSTN